MGFSIRFQRILGVRFIVGSVHDVIDEVSREGGMVVVPATPLLSNLSRDKAYREALLGAAFALADSALMVSLWTLIEGDNIPKVSGLKYLRALIELPEFCAAGASFWVLPTEPSARHNVRWLH